LRQVYTKDFNLTSEQVMELFSGPAFLPWNRMGNLKGWMGPLSPHWMQAQRDLQKRIVHRMREYGMRTVLPAFSGLVSLSSTGVGMHSLRFGYVGASRHGEAVSQCIHY
jgi:hypothetical protein